jgi:hypothetical protein
MSEPKVNPVAKPAKKPALPELWQATESAIFADGVIHKGEIAVTGAKILRSHAHLFKALEIKYLA